MIWPARCLATPQLWVLMLAALYRSQKCVSPLTGFAQPRLENSLAALPDAEELLLAWNEHLKQLWLLDAVWIGVPVASERESTPCVRVKFPLCHFLSLWVKERNHYVWCECHEGQQQPSTTTKDSSLTQSASKCQPVAAACFFFSISHHLLRSLQGEG